MAWLWWNVVGCVVGILATYAADQATVIFRTAPASSPTHIE